MPNLIDRVVFRRDNVPTTYFISNNMNGYYNETDGKFYEEDTFETELDAVENLIYVDLSTNYIYRYDTANTKFIQIGGGGGTTYYAGTGIDITNSIISAAPASITDIGGVKPDNSTIVVDANGTISGNYQAGHGILISGNEISDRTFVGTSAEWDALTPEQKAKYIFVVRTDDYGPIEVNPGHTILNNSGTEMVQRGFLQFGNELQVTDDSTNRITKVNAIPYTAGTGISITGHEISVTGGGGGGLNNLIDGEAIESLVGNDTTNNKATGEKATALGINTTASGSGSIAEGNNTIASGNYSHAEGYMTSASGNYGSHAEGSNTSASGNYSHAEGGGTLANGSASHAEGMNTRAKGMSSHAEGVMTTANGRVSHTQGEATLATGNHAHAEGLGTTASGENSHAEGYGTIAQGKYQHVSGQYNIADTSDTYALIIGNGSNKNGNITTSNALTLDWDGNLKATSYANFSSRKYKENIQDMTDEEALKLLELNPVTFDYKSNTLPNNQCGFIAEDVEKVITYPIIYENNEPDSIDYAKFVPALIKLVQIQQKQIDKLRAAASSNTNLD